MTNETSPEDLTTLIIEKLVYTKTNRSNTMKAEALAKIMKNPQLAKLILSDNTDLVIEFLAEENNLETLFFNMFESGALD